jgi:hypothetical protein
MRFRSGNNLPGRDGGTINKDTCFSEMKSFSGNPGDLTVEFSKDDLLNAKSASGYLRFFGFFSWVSVISEAVKRKIQMPLSACY